MLSYQILGTDIYHIITSFTIYSILGWIVESIYMSFCNKKLTNRGFAKGPFCPIYGFGAVIGYFILSPFSYSHLIVYFLGAFLATLFEFFVGKLMIYFLGDLWWDYNEKPFNYKGIICLESTIAWGFYALFIVYFLNNMIFSIINKFDCRYVIKALFCIFFIAFIDYFLQLKKVYRNIKDKNNKTDNSNDLYFS